MVFNLKLKELRVKNGFTQKQIAEFLLVHIQTYQRYELGTREPNFKTLLDICKVLNCTPNDLLL